MFLNLCLVTMLLSQLHPMDSTGISSIIMQAVLLVIYISLSIKTAKSAGSTVLLGWLRPSLCPSKDENDVFTGFGVDRAQKVSKSCNESVLYPPPGTDILDCQNIPRWKWEQYFVFTTVRNPYSRMRSSYNYCNVAKRANVDWGEFCQDPKVSNGCPSKYRGSSEPKVHTNNQHYQFPIHWAYHGWYGWHLDYIIRVEDMEDGIREVAKIINHLAQLRGINVRLSDNFTSVNRRETSLDKENLCKWFTGNNTDCAVALEKTMDPLVLGYTNYCSATNIQ